MYVLTRDKCKPAPNAKRIPTKEDAEREAAERNNAERGNPTWADMPAWTVRKVRATRDAWWAL